MSILAILPNSIGDFILTTPTLSALSNRYDSVSWLVPDPIWEITSLIQIKADRIRFSERQQLVKRHNWDLIVSLSPATHDHWLSWKLGGKKRIGYAHQQM